MNKNSKLLSVCGAFLAAGLIGGCATGASTGGSMGPGMSGMGGMDAGQMDMQAMCEKHKSMMAGKSTAEQQAMMNEHMRSMSPESQARMKKMHEKCDAS